MGPPARALNQASGCLLAEKPSAAARSATKPDEGARHPAAPGEAGERHPAGDGGEQEQGQDVADADVERREHGDGRVAERAGHDGGDA